MVFSRWVSLASDEQLELNAQAQRGFALSCVLSARELLDLGRSNEATLAFRRGLTEDRSLAAHVATMDYVVGRAAGRAGRRLLAGVRRFLIGRDRRHRFDYRYY